MKENIFNSPLCLGLCNKCKHIEMVNTGNGIDEPFDPVPICTKRNFEIMPVQKREEVTECEFYEPCTSL